jgi:hypothetical protein
LRTAQNETDTMSLFSERKST